VFLVCGVGVFIIILKIIIYELTFFCVFFVVVFLCFFLLNVFATYCLSIWVFGGVFILCGGGVFCCGGVGGVFLCFVFGGCFGGGGVCGFIKIKLLKFLN